MTGRVLGVDYGKKRTGVALSDPMGVIAQGLETIQHKSIDQTVSRLHALVQQYEVAQIVVGQPLTLSGRMGDAVVAVQAFVEKLEMVVALPVILIDERFTSVIAKRIMLEFGKSPSKNKAKVDEISASLILQTYLDSV